MLGIPVEENKPFKGELGLENTVQKLAILTAIGIVDAIIRAHDGAGPSSYPVHEGPEVVLMEGLVVHVGRCCFYTEIWSPVSLLFVRDVVLQIFRRQLELPGTTGRVILGGVGGLYSPYFKIRDDAAILHAGDGISAQLTRQIGVDRKSLPVTASEGSSTKGPSIGSKGNVHLRIRISSAEG